MLNLKIWTWTLGTVGAVRFIRCVIYGLIVPERFHWAEGLEGILPGFHWLTIGSLFLGLVESFILGALIAVLIVPIYNGFYRRWGIAH